ncbi:uncharacterized protein L969DRAFT_92521 [Mixia osmundae IAM 14324]|uniref:Sec1-like protein n=1 Tax=Mixia osmundae (strain CBS 9802 / IAM 14324 / JCM 22182 / KY 12970) TaxID=764103 RepID=G7DXA5_MIXOS|nr:uncharacterized protein L969DRAFT_92521 [Mixia osmundae IAM 14324]KEI41291.1 hypothetical protein L969DRAFT_92521 [Mixia osmundae IAM 14324]GAA95215.1 hypothetical protein E5Q_01871 [Mixia osmundae IAM 14324]
MSGFSVIELVRSRYLESIRSVKPANRWKIVVLDNHVTAHLNTVLKTYDVLEENVQQIENINDTARSKSPSLEALYILAPTRDNVELVLRDFAPVRPAMPSVPSSRSKGKQVPPPQPTGQDTVPRYRAVHLFFIETLDDALLAKLDAGLPQSYLLNVQEIYINFWPVEAQIFTTSRRNRDSLRILYAPPGPGRQGQDEAAAVWNNELERTCRGIVNCLTTLGEYPEIRYFDPPSSYLAQPIGAAAVVGEPVSKRLAMKVQKAMDAYCRDNADFPPAPDPPRPRGILFVTDRSMDLASPFLHEFTYQAMCNDLLKIEDGTHYVHTFTNAQGQREDKATVLSDEDKIWTDVRHMHMKDALDKLIAAFKQYQGQQSGLYGETQTSLNDLRDMLASLPGMKDAKEKLSLHLDMAEKCMGLFEQKKLPLTASVEQCCATGMTPDGKTPKTLVEEMVPLLDDRSVSNLDKVRIIALYILHRDGVPEEDRKRLYQHARLALHEMDSVDNLRHLGQEVSKDTSKRKKPLFKQTSPEDAYDISRYQPAVRYMLEEHFANRLDRTTFPYTQNPPTTTTQGAKDVRPGAVAAPASLRSTRPRWTDRKGKPANAPRQRAIVFVAGGATYAEVRTVYQLSQLLSKDILLGSSHISTPEAFVTEMRKIDSFPYPQRPEQEMRPQIPAPSPKRPPQDPRRMERPPEPMASNGYSAPAPRQAPAPPQMRQPSSAAQQPPNGFYDSSRSSVLSLQSGASGQSTGRIGESKDDKKARKELDKLAKAATNGRARPRRSSGRSASLKQGSAGLLSPKETTEAVRLRSLYRSAAQAFVLKDHAVTLDALTEAYVILDDASASPVGSQDWTAAHRRKFEILRITFLATLLADVLNSDASLPGSVSAHAWIKPLYALVTAKGKTAVRTTPDKNEQADKIVYALYSHALATFSPSHTRDTLDTSMPIATADVGAVPPSVIVATSLGALKLNAPLAARNIIEAWLGSLTPALEAQLERTNLQVEADHESLQTSVLSPSSSMTLPASASQSSLSASISIDEDARASLVSFERILEVFSLAVLPRLNQWDEAEEFVRLAARANGGLLRQAKVDTLLDELQSLRSNKAAEWEDQRRRELQLAEEARQRRRDEEQAAEKQRAAAARKTEKQARKNDKRAESSSQSDPSKPSEPPLEEEGQPVATGFTSMRNRLSGFMRQSNQQEAAVQTGTLRYFLQHYLGAFAMNDPLRILSATLFLFSVAAWLRRRMTPGFASRQSSSLAASRARNMLTDTRQSSIFAVAARKLIDTVKMGTSVSTL